MLCGSGGSAAAGSGSVCAGAFIQRPWRDAHVQNVFPRSVTYAPAQNRLTSHHPKVSTMFQ